jgi:excisionase family DNA binding protein
MNDPLGFLSEDARRALEALVREVVDERLTDVGRREQEPELLTVPEAAARLRAKPHRVYDLVEDGRLPKVKDGSRVLIKRTDLDAYLAASARRRRRL